MQQNTWTQVTGFLWGDNNQNNWTLQIKQNTNQNWKQNKTIKTNKTPPNTHRNNTFFAENWELMKFVENGPVVNSYHKAGLKWLLQRQKIAAGLKSLMR